MNTLFKNHLNEIEVLCQNYQVKSLYAIGKASGEEIDPTLEIDLLIDFNGLSREKEIENNYKMTYLLERVFQHRVELITWHDAEYLGVLNETDYNKVLLYKK